MNERDDMAARNHQDAEIARLEAENRRLRERERTEEALRKSEGLFRALVGKGADMITISDRTGRIVYASPTTERVSGYTPEEFAALNPFDSIHPDDRARCEDVLRRLVSEPGLSLDLQHRVKHKDGGWRWIEGTFTSLFHDPAIGGVVAHVRDITDSKRAEEALRESEERYRSLVVATSSIVWTAAPTGECVAPMPSWEEFTGQNFEEYQDFNWLDAVHPDDRPPTNIWENLDPENAPLEVEYRLRRRDGAYRRVVSRAVPVLDENGAVREWVGTMSDVEDERRIEEHNAYLAAVVRSAGQAVIGLSTEGVIESWNPEAQRLYGYTPEEAIGRSISLLSAPDLHAEQDEMMDVLRSGQAVSLEASRVAKDGRWVAVLLNVSPVPDAAGRTVGYSATATDITERRLVEEALRESEERYRTLFESIDEGFCLIEMIFDADGKPADYRFLETNPAFGRMTGLDGATGKTARELIPELEEFWFEVYGGVALTGDPARFEARSDAMDRWFDVYATRVGGPQDRRVALVFKDISGRKLAEQEREALRREAENGRARLEAILRQMPSGVLIFDRGGKVVLDNAEARRIYGRRMASIEECTSVATLYPGGEESSPETSSMGRSLEHGETVTNRELYIRRPDGTRRIISANSAPVRDEGGRIVAAVKTFEDITGLREAQESLHESEARFRAAFEQVRVGLVQSSLEGHILVPNPGFCQIVGYTPEEARGLHVRDVTHPDDYEADMEQARRVLDGEIPGYSMEKRYVRKDGSVVWVNLTSTVARGEDGEPMYALAIVEDIEERKRAEEALRESEERLRTVVEGAPVVLCATDREGIFTLSVGRGHEALGVEPSAVVGRSIFEVFEGNLVVLDDARRALKGETFTVVREVRYGVWESSYAPLHDEAGKVAGIIAVAVDVTERKQAEDERARAEAREQAIRVEIEEARRQLAYAAGATQERQVISRELHDRVAHSMAIVRQHLELYEVLRGRDEEAADAKLTFAKEEAKAALNNTRDLSMMLRHSEVNEGLEKALSDLLETTIPDGVSYTVEVSGDESLVPTHVGSQLFLVLREAIRNAAAHSGCDRLSVGLEVSSRRVEGRVEDDGEGFEPRNGENGGGSRLGGGMRSMKERTALMGGRFEAVSRLGIGTSIEVSVPLDGVRRRERR